MHPLRSRKLAIAVLAAAAVLAVPTVALAAHAGSSASAAAPAVVQLAIKADTQHAKQGPGGQWHDAYLPAAFTAKAGQRITVSVTNYDPAPHTFTSPKLGLSVLIAGAKGSKPTVTTFSFTPKTAGAFDWWCAAGCDPWAMSHLGYMRGRITVGA